MPLPFLDTFRNLYQSRSDETPVNAVNGSHDSLLSDVAESNSAVIDSPVGPTYSSCQNPVQLSQCLLQSFQETSGLPWWGALIGFSVLIRIGTWPLTIMQLKAIDSLGRASARASNGVKFLRGDAPYAATAPDLQKAGRKGASGTFSVVRALTRQPGMTSIYWMAGPVIQIPVLISSVWAVSDMASWPHAGFLDGGDFWFPDLTARTINFQLALETITKDRPMLGVDSLQSTTAVDPTPMGWLGLVLPTLGVMTWRKNLERLFNLDAVPTEGTVWGLPAGRMRTALRLLRGITDLISIAMFSAMLGAPQAPILYLITSMTSSMLLSRTTALPTVRTAIGLPPLSDAPTLTPQPLPITPTSHPENSARDYSNEHNVDTLYTEAVLARLENRTPCALAAAKRIQELDPSDARAWFAEAQLHTACSRWSAAVRAYESSLTMEPAKNVSQRGRIYLGLSKASLRLDFKSSALKHARNATEARPGDSQVWVALMDAELAAGSVARSRAAALKAGELNSEIRDRLPDILSRIDKFKFPRKR